MRYPKQARNRKEFFLIQNAGKTFWWLSHDGFVFEYPDARIISRKTLVEPRWRVMETAQHHMTIFVYHDLQSVGCQEIEEDGISVRAGLAESC